MPRNHTTSFVNISQYNSSLDITEKIVSDINIYYTPLLIVLGALGNIFSVYVLLKSKLRGQSTSQYLSALAVSDTIFLLQLLPPWLNALQYTRIFRSNGFCETTVYLTYVTCCLSAWLVAAFTVERFVAVVYPLRRNAVCTVARARLIIATLAVVALLVNIPVLRFAAASVYDCDIDFVYLEHAARFNLVDTTLSFTVPMAVIMILNAWIMIGVCSLERARLRLMKEAAPEAVPGVGERANRAHPHRITKMLLLVSTIFVMLNLPAYLMRALAYAYDMSTGEYSGRWAAFQQLALMLFNTNFGINFILYCLSGQNFRRAVVQVIPCLRRRASLNAARRAASAPPGRVSSVSESYETNNIHATTSYDPTTVACTTTSSGCSASTSYFATVGETAPRPGQARTAATHPKYRYMTTDTSVGRNKACLTPSVTPIPSGSSKSPASTRGCTSGRIPVGRAGGYYEEGSRMRKNCSGHCEAALRGYPCERSSCASGSIGGTSRYTGHAKRPRPRLYLKREDSFIKRWRFDNSRQRREPPIEMQEMDIRAANL